jgi:hypothetical protein
MAEPNRVRILLRALQRVQTEEQLQAITGPLREAINDPAKRQPGADPDALRRAVDDAEAAVRRRWAAQAKYRDEQARLAEADRGDEPDI